MSSNAAVIPGQRPQLSPAGGSICGAIDSRAKNFNKTIEWNQSQVKKKLLFRCGN